MGRIGGLMSLILLNAGCAKVTCVGTKEDAERGSIYTADWPKSSGRDPYFTFRVLDADGHPVQGVPFHLVYAPAGHCSNPTSLWMHVGPPHGSYYTDKEGMARFQVITNDVDFEVFCGPPGVRCSFYAKDLLPDVMKLLTVERVAWSEKWKEWKWKLVSVTNSPLATCDRPN